MIFVFGSNLAGRHGKGAALHARIYHGARQGLSEGIQGTAYAIPTKDETMRSLPLGIVHLNVRKFLRYAEEHPEETFFVTRVGCGLAGYNDAQVSPFFGTAPENCLMPPEWGSQAKRQYHVGECLH